MTSISTERGVIFRLNDDGSGQAICDGLFISFVVFNQETLKEVLKFKKDGHNIIGELDFISWYNQNNTSIFKLEEVRKLENKLKPEKKGK